MEYPQNRAWIPLYIAIKSLLLLYVIDLMMKVYLPVEISLVWEMLLCIVVLVLLISIFRVLYTFKRLQPKWWQNIVAIFGVVFLISVTQLFTEDDLLLRIFFQLRINPFLKLVLIYSFVFILILEPFSLHFFKNKKQEIIDNTVLDDGLMDEK